MRLVKLSKRVFGFDTLDACKAYFQHVLPWQKWRFSIEGEGAHIAMDGLTTGEIILFSYDGTIVCIAKSEKLICTDNRAKEIQLMPDSMRVMPGHPSLKKIEAQLNNQGFTKKLFGTQGWPIIEEKYESTVIEYLRDFDWKDYIS